MRIEKGFNEAKFKKIAQKCDNKQLLKDVSYMRVIIHNGSKIYAETLDDYAFFVGYHNKDHFRLVGIGVGIACRGKGYGRFMLQRAFIYAKAKGYRQVRTRSKSGVDFYQRWGGARIVDVKDDDYLLVMDI